ncbi:uncharacterized protein LOC100160909 precursor [Acyrthosiphon pisum]|uniref:lysozyme n=1 Tax=Acyrthosiphon pisum TaxID=7029 RepID=C4WSM7_ACYPI|nr:uncharacterized protein LOC100160909 precursor [Acyrthosiphon pisum]BAH70897.1 ACYPI002175 [Acyrthosiphon pisum]|eukprot:NP_001155465.1 uncharacterized protein LOC100160909 precursor [Acyrthosiphon pisum]
MAFNVLFATAVLCLTALSLSVSGEIIPIDEPCLGCLCEANGECSPHMKCSGEVCGMFGITYAYWADSGRPVIAGSKPTDSDAYPKCANDPKCAKESVIGYMNRYAQDCNHDRVVDCSDYAAIHKLGGFGCKGHLPQDYKMRFKTCQLSLKELSG